MLGVIGCARGRSSKAIADKCGVEVCAAAKVHSLGRVLPLKPKVDFIAGYLESREESSE